MSIKHDHTLSPITSLEYLCVGQEQLLLAGEGTYLKVFELGTSTILYQWKIFEAQTIHGIVAAKDAVTSQDDLLLVIWGGSSLTLLTDRNVKSLLSGAVDDVTELAVSAPDWILDVVISAPERSCVLITAHNTVIRANLDPENAVSLDLLSSPSRSILYSAHLVWEPSGLVLVAAGTVFGEILVWRCAVRNGQLPAGHEVLCNLTGHEGSIFGVSISPLLSNQKGKKTRLLASCSDDRTIRLWDVFDLAGLHAEPGADHGREEFKESLARETGFGGEAVGSTDRCLALAMGHASRIWDVKFYQTQDSTVNLLSVGEDSTAQRWSLESWQKLVHKETYAFHTGKHVFSTAIQTEVGKSILATGGADGKISLYELEYTGTGSADLLGGSEQIVPRVDQAQEEREQELEAMENKKQAIGGVSFSPSRLQEYQAEAWDLETILNTLPLRSPMFILSEPQEDTVPQQDEIRDTATIAESIGANRQPVKKAKGKKAPKDAFNRYAFVSENDLLITTTFGRVLHGHIDGSIRWRELRLQRSQSMALKSYSIVKGVPSLDLCFLAGTNGIVYMYRVGSETGESGTGSELLEIGGVAGKVADIFSLFSPGSPSLYVLVTTLRGDHTTIMCLKPSPTGEYHAEREPRTVMLPEKFVVTSAAIVMDDILVLGSRHGSLALYSKADEHLGTWPSVHHDAITAIVCLPGSYTLPINSSNFLTTSRDGSFSICACSLERSESGISHVSVYAIHNTSPSFGPMIEAAWFDNLDIFLYGFRSKNFIVWNETKQSEIASIDCGGAHRSYAYSPSKAGGGHFAYNKASKLHLHSQTRPSHDIVKEGGHGREIKACAVSPDKTLIATGAEDTTIRIWRYHDEERPVEKCFKSLAVVKKHTAGIQHLQWYGSEYLFSSGGNEEFFVWAVTTIPGFGVGIVCEAGCPDQSEDCDLRIMSFDITVSSAVPMKKATLLISLAYSDSTFRTYAYSRRGGFKRLARGRYTSSCLTQIRHLHTSPGEISVLTAATDGRLALWKAPIGADDKEISGGEYALLSIQNLHQNSIKSLDVRPLINPRCHLVVTGGDDNAVAITVYKLDDGSNPVLSKLVLKCAHAAAITGVCLWRTSILSTGNDQRVREWKFEMDVEGRVVGIEKVGDVFTSIADVGDIALLKDGKMLVAGNGMEVWRMGDILVRSRP